MRLAYGLCGVEQVHVEVGHAAAMEVGIGGRTCVVRNPFVEVAPFLRVVIPALDGSLSVHGHQPLVIDSARPDAAVAFLSSHIGIGRGVGVGAHEIVVYQRGVVKCRVARDDF